MSIYREVILRTRNRAGVWGVAHLRLISPKDPKLTRGVSVARNIFLCVSVPGHPPAINSYASVLRLLSP